MIQLPIDGVLPQISKALAAANRLILVAPPGTGKTTRVPPFLLNLTELQGQEIIVLEPRRIAARMSAQRVAEENGWGQPGKQVGYWYRGERSGQSSTRLWFYTEGMLVKRLLKDPELKNVGAVLLDEFHERHLTGDLALALLKLLQQGRRPDLKLIVMSATLDVELLETYLERPAVVQAHAPTYPVEIQYLTASSGATGVGVDWSRFEEALEKIQSWDSSVDILVFLSGMAEIRKLEEILRSSHWARSHEIAILHGSTTIVDQQKVFIKSSRPKIILSTNIAETSVTIPGVRAVVDGGTHRQASFSWWSGIPSLTTKSISKASAIQRTGRAARTGPGLCVRLYSKGDFEGRSPFDRPEINRIDLAETVLELIELGYDPFQVPWLDSPDPKLLQQGLDLLVQLGAIEEVSGSNLRWKITTKGQWFLDLPVHPRSAAVLHEALKNGCLDEAIFLIAALETDSFPGRNNEIIDPIREALRMRQTGQWGASLKREWERIRNAVLKSTENEKSKLSLEDRLAKSILAGFPDRVVKLKKSVNKQELLFCGGGSSELRFLPTEFHSLKYGIVLDATEIKNLSDTKSKIQVRLLIHLNEDWLWEVEPSPMSDILELFWDREKERVFQRKALTYKQLALEETISPAPPSADTTRILLEEGWGLKELSWAEIKQTIGGRLDCDSIESILARLKILRRDAIFENQLLKFIETLVGDASATSDLKDFEIKSAFLSRFDFTLTEGFYESLPDFIQLPSGRRARIRYPLDGKPFVESRLQDFIGMKNTPTVMNGKISLIVHLLAPNGRAVQVTTDLPGFWERTYPEIKNQLQRRYPKHLWP